MKRIVSFMLFSLLIVVSSFSQVQNKFFGATIGVSDLNTTYSCMYDYFGAKPAFPFGIMSLQNKVYAGYNWDAINAHFRNGKFCSLNLIYHGHRKADSYSIKTIYAHLEQELRNKYGGRVSLTVIPDEYGQSGIIYFDGRYAVSLIKRWQINERKEKEYYEVQLGYWDEKLKNEPERPIINDDL
jgi:hypothetical protein